jgi:flavorubredoxin
MNATLVANGIYQMSINVEGILFEEMWEIPKGVTVNSYIVKGEKTAIIDGFCGWDGVPKTLFELLNQIEVNPQDIDYLVINHMEPDHSGWIEDFKKIKSDFSIVCTQKAADMLKGFYGQVDNIRVVKEGDVLDLGAGKLLSFHEVPNVHWPDTMMTFEKDTNTLFACDMYGTFGKILKTNYDENLTEEDYEYFEEEGIRYYSNVMATFSSQVKKAISKTKELPVKIIAPGHGLVWRNNPEKIVEDYIRYSSYSQGPAKKEVLLLWGSMYGMTEKAVRHVEKIFEKEGMVLHSHRVPETSWGQVVASALSSTAIIVASPTYEYKLFPPVAAALEEIGKKRIANRLAFSFGSYGWSGGAQKELREIVERCKMNWSLIEPVEFLGNPTESDFKKIDSGVYEIIEVLRKS